MAGSKPNQENTLLWPLSAPESPVERRGSYFNKKGAKSFKIACRGSEGLPLAPFSSQQFQHSRFPECLLFCRRHYRACICMAPKATDWLLNRKYPPKILQIFFNKALRAILVLMFYMFRAGLCNKNSVLSI